MGPLELVDYVGLDTTQSVLNTYRRFWPDHPLFQPIKGLDDRVSAGKTGIKAGEGYYKYNK